MWQCSVNDLGKGCGSKHKHTALLETLRGEAHWKKRRKTGVEEQGRVQGRRRRSKEGGRQATPALTTETHKAA